MATSKRFKAKNGLDNGNQTLTGVSSGGRTIDIAGNFTTTTGAVTIAAQSGGSSVTLPSSGTLAKTSGETLTNVTLSGTVTAGGSAGTSGQVLQSTGTGVQWAAASSGTVTGTGTTNQIAYWTSSSAVGALATSTYPSLTELAYVKGATSSLQNQIDNKVDEANGNCSFAYNGLSLKASTSGELLVAPSDATLSATRTLSLKVNDANRTIDLSGNLTVSAAATVSGTNTGDQTISLTGDVTGSGTGSFAATIASKAVTLAKMADVATATVFYRKTAGTGAPETQTLATLKTDLGLTGTNSGDQTSIVGITGTKAQFDTACSDGDFLYSGSAASVTDLTVTGDLTVNGTTTTLNSTTLTIDDKNIELGSVTTPTNTTADGGGITLKGATDKTFNWVNSTTSWTSSENLDLASGKTFKIGTAEVLSTTALTFTNAVVKTATLTTSATTANQTIDSFDSTKFRSANYFIQVSSGSSYHMTQVSLIHDGTTVYLNEYGTVATAEIATFDASLSLGTLSLTTTPTNAVTTYKVIGQLIAA